MLGDGCSSVQHPSERVMSLQGCQELYFRAHTANVVPDKLAIPARCHIVVQLFLVAVFSLSLNEYHPVFTIDGTAFSIGHRRGTPRYSIPSTYCWGIW